MIQRTWPDAESLLIEISCKNSFPDVVAEVRQAAVRAYEDALAVTLAPVEDDGE